MKGLCLILPLFLSITGCGQSSNPESKNPSQTDFSQQEIRTCGYEGSRIRALCIPQADYVINSNKPFPAKIKILVISNNRRIERFNECSGTGNFKVLRGISPEKIVFDETRKLYYEGMDFEIVDMGETCDNNAIFFAGIIKPTVQLIQGDRDIATFDLEN
jgi:hypothetical protein